LSYLLSLFSYSSYVSFLFKAPATTDIYTLSLHDALPIYRRRPRCLPRWPGLAESGRGKRRATPGYRFRRGGRRASPGAWKPETRDRKSTRLNSSHDQISYAVFCLKKKKKLKDKQDIIA